MCFHLRNAGKIVCPQIDLSLNKCDWWADILEESNFYRAQSSSMQPHVSSVLFFHHIKAKCC